MFARPNSKPPFKSIIFYQNSPKIKIFLQEMQNFRTLGAPPPDPQNNPPLRISGYPLECGSGRESSFW